MSAYWSSSSAIVTKCTAGRQFWPSPYTAIFSMSFQSARESYGDLPLGSTLREALTYPLEWSELPRIIHLALEDYILFYMNLLAPSLRNFVEDVSEGSLVDKHASYLQTALVHNYFLILKDIYIGIRPSVLERRQASGLLRANQVRLVALVIKMAIDVTRRFVEEASEHRLGHTNGGGWRTNMCCTRAWHPYVVLQEDIRGTLQFFLDNRFRSERLVLLLVGYLSDPDINVEVVERLAAAERQNRKTPRNYSLRA
ncbi:hypothetical protein BJ508DRAFT_181767 [Ascobolus immersus RN42]|uniref:Uncharacterized protein n=1 Tax=Ascobolus immersus RN42 TaxID=1160509 RepID=A0A3N4HS30_ASCIM|nr:hypothetical protein BJ508DRAFT_181767 [Ascobolus immersus RN42]